MDVGLVGPCAPVELIVYLFSMLVFTCDKMQGLPSKVVIIRRLNPE